MTKVIETEGDLLLLLRNFLEPGELYPNVTHIPKGKRISPDIDLLEIHRYRDPPIAVGYEVKLMKPSWHKCHKRA